MENTEGSSFNKKRQTKDSFSLPNTLQECMKTLEYTDSEDPYILAFLPINNQGFASRRLFLASQFDSVG